MKNIKFLIGLIVGISLTLSCTEEFDFSTDKLSSKTEQNSEVALPLVNASITLDEVLNDKDKVNRLLVIDGNKFITLVYEFEFSQYPATNFFSGYSFSGTNLPYLNQTTGTQSIGLELNKLQNYGEFYIADPKITISIKNYWNIPTRFRFTNFFYYKQPNSAALPVTGTLVNQWITVNRPVAPSKYAITDVVMNSTNTNMDVVISALPHHLSFNANYETIPGGPYTVDPNSTDSVKVKIEVPLDLRVSNVYMKDTMDFDLGKSFEDTTVLNSILLNLIVDNGFPFSIDAQMYFVDNNYLVLDSIATKPISFSSGKTTNGKVTESTQTVNKIQIDGNRISKILKAKHLITRMNFNTANASIGETVKIYSNYKLGLKVGALIKMRLKT